MSTMIMRIDVEATLGEKTGEGAVAAGVLAKPVVDLYDAQRSSRGGRNIKTKDCPRGRLERGRGVEWHVAP